jgi:hypothetical protein
MSSGAARTFRGGQHQYEDKECDGRDARIDFVAPLFAPPERISVQEQGKRFPGQHLELVADISRQAGDASSLRLIIGVNVGPESL